jgi:SAM-dependent methyltransferase
MEEIQGNSQYGTDTLGVISAAGKFNRWMYETIKPHCHGEILEIGSGIGNISGFFIADNAAIALSDFDSEYLPGLQKKFGSNSNLQGVYHIDFSDKNMENTHPELIGKFDTIFALNVVEHIPDHIQAVKNAHKMLRKDGTLIILVPAFQWLFNRFDEQLDHQRRYNKKSLKELVISNGFEVVHSQYFNFIGILGWFVSGKILGKEMIPEGQMKLYDTLVPLWKIIDFFTSSFAGLSVIQASRKIDK